MPAGKYSFTIEKGATVDFRIDYTDANSNPIDLTNYHARMQVRPTINSGTVFLYLSSSILPDGTGLDMTPTSASLSSSVSVSTVLPKSSGSISIYISAISSSFITTTEAYYDLEIVSGSTNKDYVNRLLEGKIKVKDNVTR